MFRTRCALAAFAALSLAVASAAGQPVAAPPEPRYDTGTVVNLAMVVAETREVAKGNPLAGMHVQARLESARANAETVDVYLGPAEFIKQFDLVLHAGDRVEVTGSKIKSGATAVILCRELRRGNSTLYIRDPKGEPVWNGQM